MMFKLYSCINGYLKKTVNAPFQTSLALLIYIFFAIFNFIFAKSPFVIFMGRNF